VDEWAPAPLVPPLGPETKNDGFSRIPIVTSYVHDGVYAFVHS
jgi:hypothetical protein